MRTLISFDSEGLLVLSNEEGLIAVIKNCPWQTAHLIADGMDLAKKIHKVNPDLSVTDILSQINHIPTDAREREWADSHPRTTS